MAPNLTRDRLSDLPDGILENIFKSLSTRDVVRTSILSTKWRYRWISNPYLIFNDKCIPDSVCSDGHRKLVEIVNHVLLTHRGPIQAFKIFSLQHLQTCPEISSWILSLTLDSLTELEVQISGSSHLYSVPPSLFSFKHLIRLTLNFCMIPLPPLVFKGFRCLTSLDLECVELSDATLDCLLSSCPELEHLSLFEIVGLDRIQLRNPKLKYLYIFGKRLFDTLVCCMTPILQLGFRCLTSLFLIDVILSDATMECLLSSCPKLEKLTLVEIQGPTHIQLRHPKLKNLIIYGDLFIVTCFEDLQNLVSATFKPRAATHLDEPEKCNFGHVLGFLLGVEELCLGDSFLQYLPYLYLDVPRRLPSTFYHLKTIDLTLNVADMKEILVAICLLNSSPNLQKLVISLQHVKEYALFPLIDMQEVKDQFESSFNKLSAVTINSFVGTEVDLIITKFILANSPVLELMKIIPSVHDISKVLTLSKELLRFKRASPEAEIEFGQ